MSIEEDIAAIVTPLLAAHKQEVASMLKDTQASFQQTIVAVLQQRGLIPRQIRLSHRGRQLASAAHSPKTGRISPRT